MEGETRTRVGGVGQWCVSRTNRYRKHVDSNQPTKERKKNEHARKNPILDEEKEKEI